MKRIAIALVAVAGFALANTSTAEAGGPFGGLSLTVGGGHHHHGHHHHRSTYVPRSGPVYHPPSIQYDRVYHRDYLHWTPSRGLHSHGHTHTVPRYVPGHYDYQHGNHIHTNPLYHR